jgi:hypothetical protein
VANKRVFYAVQSVGVSKCGEYIFTMIHGLQSLGLSTKYNLEQVFEMGQIAIYDNVENIPDVECTTEKVLDGYPLIYHLATKGATSATLSGRSNIRATVGLSIYSDTQDSASGTPLAQCTVSGVYVSALAYNFQTQGTSKESVTLVGNNKFWNNTFTAAAFNNTDVPLAISGSGGTNHRQDVLLGEQAGEVCRFPIDIPGVSSSGYVPYDTVLQQFAVHTQSLKVSTNLGREQLFELGRRGPYHRYATFPVEVKTDIEVISISGDQVSAFEETPNLVGRKIYVTNRDGTKIDLGSQNKLSSVTYGGANAGQNGGNATATYSYSNFNIMTVTHPQDPSGL